MAALIEHSGRRVLFAHIPKTGGVWVETALIGAGIQCRYADLSHDADRRHALPSMVSEEYDSSFCFVRRPRDWYRSWWSYFHADEADLMQIVRDKWHPLLPILEISRLPLPDFLRAVIRDQPGFLSRLYRSYELDHVGALEDQPESLIRCLRLCGVEDFDEETIRRTCASNQSPETGRSDIPEWGEIERLENAATRTWNDARSLVHGLDTVCQW